MFQPIKVLIVDSNIVVRKMISEYLETLSGVEVVSTANNGVSGIQKWHRYKPEIILCDLHLPGKDGYAMSMDILKENKDVAIIVVSALNDEDAKHVINMMSDGVADYIIKPADIASGHSKQEFWRSLKDLIMNHGPAVKLRRANPDSITQSTTTDAPSSIRSVVNNTVFTPPSPVSTPKLTPTTPKPPFVQATPPPTPIRTPPPSPAVSASATNKVVSTHNVSQPLSPAKTYDIVKPTAVLPPKMLAIGSSTGGPAALTIFLKELKRCGLRSDVPVFITQHMPPIFTARLADQLTMNTGFTVLEAKDNMVIENGKFYLAPGDYHMHLGTSADGENNVVRLKQTPKVNFCRPAVDEMLDSLVTKYKPSQMLTVILTGMGSDGKKSCVKIRKGGGTIFAQNEETSAVWGMPGAVATANICSAVSPLQELAKQTVKYMKEARL